MFLKDPFFIEKKWRCDGYDDQRITSWPSRDPLGEDASVNLYIFAENNTSSYYDFAGLKIVPFLEVYYYKEKCYDIDAVSMPYSALGPISKYILMLLNNTANALSNHALAQIVASGSFPLYAYQKDISVPDCWIRDLAGDRDFYSVYSWRFYWFGKPSKSRPKMYYAGITPTGMNISSTICVKSMRTIEFAWKKNPSNPCCK